MLSTKISSRLILRLWVMLDVSLPGEYSQSHRLLRNPLLCEFRGHRWWILSESWTLVFILESLILELMMTVVREESLDVVSWSSLIRGHCCWYTGTGIIRRKLLLCCTAGSPHNATHTLHHTTLSHCHSDLFIHIPSYSTCGSQSNFFKLFNVNSSKLISWLIYIRCEATTSCSEEDGSSLWWQLLKQITAYNSLAKYIQIMKLNFLGKHSIQDS